MGGADDEHGAELVSCRRSGATRPQRSTFPSVRTVFSAPREIVTDQLCSYPAAKAGIPELANVKHVFMTAAAGVHNRAENSHQPTRERERRMRGFRDPKRTQAFLASCGLIRQHFALKRHLLRASPYRQHLAVRFSM